MTTELIKVLVPVEDAIEDLGPEGKIAVRARMTFRVLLLIAFLVFVAIKIMTHSNGN